MGIHLHQGDLPCDVRFVGRVAVDSETMGLNVHRDALCVVQLSAGDGEAHVVRLDRKTYDAPNLKKLLADPRIVKIFHFARFDMAALKHYLGVVPTPVYCTKIASKLARTYTDRHGLKDVVRELLAVELTKQQQSSDWGTDVLSKAQLSYAAADVLYLHAVQEKLDSILLREGRTALAQACFECLPTRMALDLAGWDLVDIFAHA